MLDGERLALKIVRAPRRLDLVDELPRLPPPGASIQDLYTQPFGESTRFLPLRNDCRYNFGTAPESEKPADRVGLLGA